MNDLLTFSFIAQTTALVIASLFLLYPVVAYAHNVAHTRGLVLISSAFVVLTVSYVVWAATGTRDISAGMGLVPSVLNLAAAVTAAAGVWQFARPFVRFGDEELDASTVGETAGGFESAGDD